MKRIISTSFNQSGSHFFILLLRVAVALFMLNHGLSKMQKLFDDSPIKFANPIGIGEVPSLVLTVFAEAFCSFLLLIGLFTRLAAIPLMITMLVAIVIIHGASGFEDAETALLYFVIYLFLMYSGSGKYSVDRYLETKYKSI